MKKILSLLTTLLLLTSCSHEELGTPFYAGQEVSISAAFSSDNPANNGKQRISGKDNVDRIDLTWDEGDEILVTVGDKSAVFTLSSGAGTNNATFTGTMPADGNAFHVTYPVNYTDDVLSHQTYTANGFGNGLMKMSTKIPGTLNDGFVLSADNSLLGLKLQGDANVSKIVLTQKDNDDNAENDKTYTLDCSAQVVNTADGALFYIVVPAGTWENGLKVEVYNDNGIVIEERTKTSPAEFVAGQALMMPEVEVHDILTFEVNGVKFNMVYVEGGTFIMGSDKNDAPDNTKPAHSVTLSDYYIGQTEVTQELWEAVMESNPSYFQATHNPVERVTWSDCQKFIKKLNLLTGRHFRLPTEAEWEYAARGGNRSKGYIYAGSDIIGKVAWYINNSNNKAQTVKQKYPNELGIYDMSGNVWEWCQDWYGDYSSDAQINPQGSSSGSARVIRGGSWMNDANSDCCTFGRLDLTPAATPSNLGFRITLDMHDYVDLGLSVKWATCNVGATTPEEYGDYFAWGETSPKEIYGWNTYKWCDGTENNMTKYNTTDGLTTLLPEDDAAHVHWGGQWRMPTKEERDELLDKCIWTWESVNGVEGFRATGPNGNSIFLPAAGIYIETRLLTNGLNSYFFTSVLADVPPKAYSWYFADKETLHRARIDRSYGCPIRPALPKN
jgi:formylglycine-generating enzyme required for sulfatase activity